MSLVTRTTNAPPGVRYKSIDGVRGLLAATVFVYHFMNFFGSQALYSAANFSVCAFFVMSGYVLSASYDNHYLAFLTKRFVRLWPVYALCLALGYAVQQIWPNWTQFFWYPVLNGRSLPRIDPPIWSLCIEAWAMLFMPFIVWAGRTSALSAIFGFIAISFAGNFEPKLLFGLFFLTGACLSRWQFQWRPLETSIPQALGRMSYTLYLVHWPILSFANTHFGATGLIAALPVVFAASWALCLYVDEPSIRLSRTLSRRVRQARWLSSRAELEPAPRA